MNAKPKRKVIPIRKGRKGLTLAERMLQWDAQHKAGARLGAVKVESEEGSSARYIWRSLIAGSQLPASARLVAMMLTMHGSAHGEDIYPSTLGLAGESGLCEKSVCTQLDILACAGYIQRQPRGAGRKWAGTVYELYAPAARVEKFTEVEPPYIEDRSGTTGRRTEPAPVPRRTGTAPVPSGYADVTRDAGVTRRTGTDSNGTGTDSNGTGTGSNGTGTGSTDVLEQFQSSLSSETVSTECGAAPRTAGPDPSSKANPQTPSPKPATENERRLDRLCRVIQDMPEADDATVKLCVLGSTIGEVRIARRMLARTTP